MTPERDVVTIVVTYNSATTIGRCLRCIEASSLRPRIVVVDNASSDETRALLGRDFPDVTVVPSAQNAGFAAACNLGMASAAVERAGLLPVRQSGRLRRAHLPRHVGRRDGGEPTRRGGEPAHPRCELWGDLVRRVRPATSERGIYWHLGVGERDAGQYTETVVTGRPTGCVMLVRRAAVEAAGVDGRLLLLVLGGRRVGDALPGARPRLAVRPRGEGAATT